MKWLLRKFFLRGRNSTDTAPGYFDRSPDGYRDYM